MIPLRCSRIGANLKKMGSASSQGRVFPARPLGSCTHGLSRTFLKMRSTHILAGPKNPRRLRNGEICRMFHDESKPIFADYTLYGRDSISDLSMAVSFLRPSLRESNNGNYLALGNRGSILLKFTRRTLNNVNGESSYDWMTRESFWLGPSAIGDVIGCDPKDELNFIRKDKSEEDPNTFPCEKTLSVGIQRPDGQRTIRLVVNKDGEDSKTYELGVSKGEFALIRALFHSIAPHLFGWSQLVSPMRP